MVEARIQCFFASQSSYLLQDQARGAYLLPPCHPPASPVLTDKRVIYWRMSGNPLFCRQEEEMSLPLREMLPPVQQICKYNNFMWCASFSPAKGFPSDRHSGNNDRHHFSLSRHQFSLPSVYHFTKKWFKCARTWFCIKGASLNPVLKGKTTLELWFPGILGSEGKF